MSVGSGSISAGPRRAALAVLLALTAALAFSAPAQAEELSNHPFNKVLLDGLVKESKPPVAELEDPCGVAVGSAGEIYLSDYYREVLRGPSRPLSTGRLEFPTSVKFDPDNGACGLAIDEEGSLYVNFFHGDVVKYIPNIYPPPGPGEPPLLYTTEVIHAGHSTGVAVDPRNGDLLVDMRNGIGVYSAPVEAGDVPAMVGAGSLEDGYGVAISTFPATEGQIYAADAADHEVKVYDPSTDADDPIRTIDGAGTAPGRFVSLADAALATDQTDGHLFVADNTQPGFKHPAAVIDEFNADGLYRGQLDRPLIDGKPVGIAINETPTGRRGEIYVTTGNGTALALPPEEGTPVGEQSALLAFGPGAPGQRLAVSTSGAGGGSVASAPAGIACPGSCEAEFNEGAIVSLTATPAPGSAFAGWTGGGCSGTGACAVTMESAAAVDAQFIPAPAPLAPHSVSAATSAAAVAGPPTPGDGVLRVGRASAAGAVVLEATAPGPGTLTARGEGLRLTRVQIAAAGRVAVRLRLDRGAVRALARSGRGRLTIRVALSFAPSDGGAASSMTRTVAFRPRG